MKEKLTFKDLSIWLKFAVLGGIIYFFLAVIAFLFGFLDGILSSGI